MIGIIYSAFDQFVDQMNAEGGRKVNPGTTAIIPLPDCFKGDDLEICETLFRDTNLYEGPFWDRLEPVLPETRTHTALSVGDFVFIDDRRYLCKSFGWERV